MSRGTLAQAPPRFRPRLGRRLLVALLVAGILPVVITGHETRQEQERTLRAEALKHAAQTANMLTGVVERFADALQEDMREIAGAPDLRAAVLRGDCAGAQRALETHASLHPRLRGTTLVDAGGIARAGTGAGAALLGMDLSERPNIATARQLRGPVITDPLPSPSDWKPVILTAIPILNGDRIAGVLGGAVSLEVLIGEIQRVKIGETGFASLQTPQGWVIAHRDRSQILELAPLQTLAPLLLQRGPTGALETTRPDGTLDFTGFATVPGVQWVVVTQIPAVEALASLAALQRNAWTLVGWLLAMVGVFALIYGRMLARPMADLSEAARAVGSGELGRRVALRRNDEVGEVARAFNEMAGSRERAEAALQVSLARRDALTRLSAAIAAGTDQAGTMRQVVEATARLLGAPYAVLWTPDPQGARLIPGAEYVDPSLGPLPPQSPIPTNESFVERVSSEKSPLAVPDVRGHPDWTNQAWPGLQFLGSYLGLHFEGDGRAAGILCALDRPGRTFTPEEIELLGSLGTHAALAIEKARLLEDARCAAAESQALVGVGKLLTETVDLDIVLTRVVEKAGELLRASAAGVGLIEPGDRGGEQTLRFVQTRGLPPAHRQAHVLCLGESVAGKAIQEGRPVWSSDVLADPGIWLSEETRRRILDHGIPRALLAAPLAPGESVIGALVVYRPAGSAYTASEVELLAALASQAAIAIQNAWLYEQERAGARNAQVQRERAEALAAVGQAISASLDVNQVLGLVVERAATATGADAAVVMQREADTGNLRFRRAHGLMETHLEGLVLPAGKGIVGVALATGQPAWTRDLPHDPRFQDPGHILPLVAAEGLRAVLSVPIRGNAGPYGVLSLYRHTPHDFDDGEIAFADRIADQAAIAIENARLFADAVQKRAEAEALEELGRLISSTLDQEEIFRVLIERTCRVLGVTRCALWESRPEGDGFRLHLRHSLGLDPGIWDGVHLRMGEGATGICLARRAPVWTADCLADPALDLSPATLERARAEGYRSLCTAPILLPDGPFGVLAMYRDDVHAFDAREVALLSAFADQAAIAIENARLFHATTQRAQEMAAIHEAGRAITETLDLKTTLTRIAESTRHLAAAARSLIWLVDPEDGTLEVGIATGPGAETFLGIRVPAESPAAAARAVREKRIILVPDALDAAAADPALSAHLGNGALLAIPLGVGETTPAVLVLGYERPRTFADGEADRLGPLAQQAAIAIQNALLFHEEQGRRRQVEAVRAVSEDITRELDLSKLLALIIQSAGNLVGAASGTVYLWDETAQVLTPAACCGHDELVRDVPLRLGEGLSGTVAQRRRGMIANDYRSLPFANPAFLERTRVTASLGEPLLYRDRLVGVISLNDGGTGRRFTEDDRSILGLFAAQAAVAIENAHLYEVQRAAAERAEGQRARADALEAVGRAVSTSLDLEQVLTLVVERTGAVTGADAVAVLQRDPATGELRFGRTHGFTKPVEHEVIPAGRGIAGAALDAGRPTWTPDLQHDPRFAAPGRVLPLVAQEGIRATLTVPIRGHDGPYGVLSICRRRVHHFDEEEIAFVARIADQAAIAIENARLYEESQRRAREATALAEVGRALSESLDMERVLERIGVEVRQMMEAAFVGVMRLDEAGQELAYVAGVGLPRERFAHLRVKVGEGFTGRAVAQRAPIHVPDLSGDSRVLDGGIIREEGFRSVFCAPLMAGDRVLGSIDVFRRDASSFTPAEVQLLTRFADQAAIAIENARLYAEVQDHSQTLERKVAERTAELEAASRAKSEFLANMSHELRTPLNGIIGFADLLRMPTFGPLSPKQLKYVQNIQTSGVHLLNLVNDVLDLARVEAGRLALRPEQVALALALAEALDGVRPQAAQKGLSLACEAEPDLPAVHADPVRLRQILVNLLSNAVKFTPEGGRVTLAAVPAGAGAGSWVEIRVEDTGIGIAPEDLPRLFRKFEQLDAGSAKARPGAGLGLALTKHLVELHGGTIAAHSAGRGQGSTFTVRLPAGPQRDRPKVLVVDDDSSVGEMLTAAIRDRGWEATAAATLAEARTALDQGVADLVILDSRLPDGSGVEFVHQIRNVLARRLPILMYTGLGAEEGRVALKAGADDFLVKPAPLELIHRKVTTLLARAGWSALLPGPEPEDGEGPGHGVTPSRAVTAAS